MDAVALQERLEDITKNLLKDTFIFEVLLAYGLPKSTITLLKNSPSKLSGKADQIILKNKILFHASTPEEDVHAVIDDLQKDKNTYKYNPRFIIVTDFKTLLAVDTKTTETRDIEISDLGRHYAFFLPWAGMEKAQHVNENPADIRAASKMARIYDQIIKDNPDYVAGHTHDLNVFLSWLLFCYFAEDTSIFDNKLFTDSIKSHSSIDGGDLKTYLDTLFGTLNTPEDKRKDLPHHFIKFPYVNGGLFDRERKVELPIFTATTRKLIIECGDLDWSAINPDIFGSMIQAVVHPGQRDNFGMHYTSVPNIMKVIEPLFLNDLYEEMEKSNGDAKKLNKLRERIAQIKVFDPACGSGNFLIISYKELCKLEAKILSKIKDLGLQVMPLSGISLNSFYGIEIDDFAHEIATLSLWLAQHQMNTYFDDVFGITKPTLPLKESGQIVKGNAIRLDWNEVCARIDYRGDPYEIYIVGNPPYLGSRNQEEVQKEDLKSLFVDGYKSLDYISAWFYKGAKYISGHENIRLAFVSTNSISQGEQVALLWPRIFSEGIEIFFAHQSFKWKNLAKGNAGVTCVIIGLSNPTNKTKRLYSGGQYLSVQNINPYLTEAGSVFIVRRSRPLSSDFPQMVYGNLLNDGGNFVLTKEEKDDLISRYPQSKVLIRNYIGSQEFIRGQQRWCLYIQEDQIELARSIPEINTRLNNIQRLRSASTEKSTRLMADSPHRYYFNAHKETNSIIIPRTSSENREYIPMGFLDKKTIISDAAQVIYNAEPFIFGILTSHMHMVWIRAVGGRLESSLRYSSALCYNTFPFPKITHQQKEMITNQVRNILDERERYSNKTLAELYDPDRMPDGLREAHKYLDIAIDKMYRSKPFGNDVERLAHLFKLYEEMTTKETNQKDI